MTERENKLTKSKIKERGWSESMIKKLLGEPDEWKKVSGYSNELCLYRESRVLKAEGDTKFSALKEKALKRSIAGKKAAATRIQRMQEYVNSMEIMVPDYGTEKEVLQKACKHWYKHKLLREERRELNAIYSDNYQDYYQEDHDSFVIREPDPEKADKSFLYRITHNMIRHSMSDYEGKLNLMANKIGVPELERYHYYESLKTRVTEEINLKYTWLKNY